MSTASAISVPPTTPRLGLEESVIGNYKIIKTIYDGEVSVVKMAQRIDTEEHVAIKITYKSLLTTNKLKKLYREIAIMKKLDHPNIVKLVDVIESQKKLYLIMEYVSGSDLFEYLDRSPYMSEKETRKVLRQIIPAVEFCHRNGVIHRDLKLENVLVDSKLNVKLADFGLSNTFDSEQKLWTMCGTPAYIAPELFQNKPYGPEADVWSLGVMLYYLVTGDLPFDNSTFQQTKKEVLRCQYNIPPRLSLDCRNLIKRILILEPYKRPTLVSIMEDRWINHEYEEVLKPYVQPGQDMNDSKK